MNQATSHKRGAASAASHASGTLRPQSAHRNLALSKSSHPQLVGKQRPLGGRQMSVKKKSATALKDEMPDG